MVEVVHHLGQAFVVGRQGRGQVDRLELFRPLADGVEVAPVQRHGEFLQRSLDRSGGGRQRGVKRLVSVRRRGGVEQRGFRKCGELANAFRHARGLVFQFRDHRLRVALLELERQLEGLRQPAQGVRRKAAGGSGERVRVPACAVVVLGGQGGTQILAALAQPTAEAVRLVADGFQRQAEAAHCIAQIKARHEGHAIRLDRNFDRAGLIFRRVVVSEKIRLRTVGFLLLAGALLLLGLGFSWRSGRRLDLGGPRCGRFHGNSHFPRRARLRLNDGGQGLKDSIDRDVGRASGGIWLKLIPRALPELTRAGVGAGFIHRRRFNRSWRFPGGDNAGNRRNGWRNFGHLPGFADALLPFGLGLRNFGGSAGLRPGNW